MSRAREMLLVLAWSALVCSAAADSSGGCEKPRHVLHLPGDATVTVMLDLHHGPNCSVTSARGRLQLAAVAWTVHVFNYLRELPSVSLGAVVYDSCSSASAAQKALVSALVERDCLHTYHLGLVMGRRTLGWLKNLVDSLGLAPSVLAETPPSPRQAARWLAALGGPKRMHVIAPTQTLLQQFGAAAAEDGVCVRSEHLLSSGLAEINQSLSTPSLVLALGSTGEMDAVLDHLSDFDFGSSATRWLFFPTEGVLEPGTIERMPPNSLVSALRTDLTGLVETGLKNLGSQDYAPHLDSWALPKNGLFMAIASSILENTERLKVTLMQFCGTGKGICKALPVFDKFKSLQVKEDMINKLLKRFNFSSIDESVGIHRVVSVNGTGKNQLEEIGVFRQGKKTDSGTTLKMEWLSNSFRDEFFRGKEFSSAKNCDSEISNVNASECEECVNFAKKLTNEQTWTHTTSSQTLTWQHEAWVAAVVSIAALGVVGCTAIAIFIAVRILKGDVLEGHPGVSFLLLMTIVLMYCSVLSYGFTMSGNARQNELLCGTRVTATCLSYALLFSIMIARGVMLASCDQEGGFMSHVNGYLQAVLCFFIAAVQVGLSLQFWLLNPAIFRSDHCSLVRDGYYLPLALCYDAFLLLVMVWVAPFIVRSKRNYREGAFFTAATLVTVLVWTGWVSIYLLAPKKWRDAAAAGGLAATATGILVTVFIPRSYLMVTTIVRDQLASALPALARASEGSIQNIHYRSVTSSQPLYDCVQQVATDIGHSNPNFYCEQTTVVASGDLESRKSRLTPENTYERYDTPPAPDNITRF